MGEFRFAQDRMLKLNKKSMKNLSKGLSKKKFLPEEIKQPDPEDLKVMIVITQL